MRIDINSPIEPSTGTILDDTRMRSHVATIEELSGTRLVLLAHQSRPGLEDFTTLEAHARRLAQLLGREVRYVDDVFGRAAREEISGLRRGEVLLLENVRFCSEEVAGEVKTKPPEAQAKTNLVRKLSSYVEAYVNDAFAVAHRTQPSVVAFPVVLPSYAGRLLEREVENLTRVLKTEARPKVFCFGGAKVKDSIRVMEKLLSRGIADVVLTSGMVANIFLLAQGVDIGEVNLRTLEEKGLLPLVEGAKRLLRRYGDSIQVPSDLAFRRNGHRAEAGVDDLPNLMIMDIGIDTIARYSRIIEEAAVVAANGPAGVFEIREFALGSEGLLKAMARCSGFTVIGGGHLAAIAARQGLRDKISFISTGGKAMLLFLAGEKLPGIEVLKEARGDDAGNSGGLG
ncbi:MAG: phosphoglycerate kinase [Euryarchaeota archaeon]|nr:phosphoglycerate kinase [Euryarchaeota archaeon]